jgi:hypothetical protein
MQKVSVKTAAKLSAYITLPLEMLYCMLCAILITFPLWIALNIVWGVLMLFSTPQVEKPTVEELLKAEDDVLNNGGAFTAFHGSL